MRVGNSAVPLDEHTHRHCAQSIFLSESIVGDHHGIIHLFCLDERFHDLPAIVVHRSANHGQTAPCVVFLEFHVPGDFSLASVTPSRPKIEEHNSAFVIGQSNRSASRIDQGERRRHFSCIHIGDLSRCFCRPREIRHHYDRHCVYNCGTSVFHLCSTP